MTEGIHNREGEKYRWTDRQTKIVTKRIRKYKQLQREPESANIYKEVQRVPEA